MTPFPATIKDVSWLTVAIVVTVWVTASVIVALILGRVMRVRDSQVPRRTTAGTNPGANGDDPDDTDNHPRR